MFLLDDILLAPLKGIIWVGSKFQDMADGELTDMHALRKKLLELQLLYEMDEVSDDEYELREKELLDLLEAASQEPDAR
jgi:hypothetical protein